jgi:hypothetical protein
MRTRKLAGLEKSSREPSKMRRRRVLVLGMDHLVATRIR